jgi:hypothetical protein
VIRRLWPAARHSWVVTLAAAVVVLVRLPWLGAPLSSDEGGFLFVAGQWHHGGGSLYGSYWVDRPPLLIGLFALAHLLGGTVALRLLGCVAAVVVVLLAAKLGRLVGGDRCVAWCAVAAAAFASTPLFGARQVSGELLATPFVLGGLCCFLAAREQSQASRRTWLLAAAGASGAGAFLVKQSFVDVFVFVVFLALAELLRGENLRVLLRHLTSVGGGAVATIGATLAVAATLGTTPAGLWQAVILFRADASRVIAESASAATADRLHRFPVALVASGAVVVILLLVVRAVRLGRPEPLTVGLVGLLAWEGFAVVGGGSYWLHYLVGLVPCLVLGTALVVRDADRLGQVARLVVCYAAVAMVVSNTFDLVSPPATSKTYLTGEWLEAHRVPGDTVFVAYGQPNILAEAGTPSPYRQLWSLPIRVLDPDLRELTSVLESDRAPVWLLVASGRLATWGIDPTYAQQALSRYYRPVADVCGFVVYLRDGVDRPHDTGSLPDRCTGRADGRVGG